MALPTYETDELWDALRTNDWDALAAICDAAHDQPDLYRELLHHAGFQGNLALLKWCIARKADVNVANERGETAFSFACAYNQFEAAKILFDAGAQINTCDVGGGSPLDWAVCHASQEFRDWLVANGAVRHDDSYPPWPPRDSDDDCCSRGDE